MFKKKKIENFQKSKKSYIFEISKKSLATLRIFQKKNQKYRFFGFLKISDFFSRFPKKVIFFENFSKKVIFLKFQKKV